MKLCLVKIINCLKNNNGVLFMIAGMFAVVDFFWLNFIFKDNSRNDLNNLLVLFAFLAAYYYALITKRMWTIGKDPVLRLQWNDIGFSEYVLFKKLRSIKDGEDNYANEHPAFKEKMIDYYNCFTDLQLVNDGKSPALDLVISALYTDKKQPIEQLKNVTAISGHGNWTQLKFYKHPGANKGHIFNDENASISNPFVINIKYKDTQNYFHEVEFIVDHSYNDGFRIKIIK